MYKSTSREETNTDLHHPRFCKFPMSHHRLHVCLVKTNHAVTKTSSFKIQVKNILLSSNSSSENEEWGLVLNRRS